MSARNSVAIDHFQARPLPGLTSQTYLYTIHMSVAPWEGQGGTTFTASWVLAYLLGGKCRAELWVNGVLLIPSSNDWRGGLGEILLSVLNTSITDHSASHPVCTEISPEHCLYF